MKNTLCAVPALLSNIISLLICITIAVHPPSRQSMSYGEFAWRGSSPYGSNIPLWGAKEAHDNHPLNNASGA